jgi:hypothetical protein
MGFFSGVRRRIKKLIPKEVRPFIPYLAAMIPGAGVGLGAFAKSNPAMEINFLMAALVQEVLTDDEARFKRCGNYDQYFAAAPQHAIGEDFAGPVRT